MVIYMTIYMILSLLMSSSVFRIIKLKDLNRNITPKTLFYDAKRFVLPLMGKSFFVLFIYGLLSLLVVIPGLLFWKISGTFTFIHGLILVFLFIILTILYTVISVFWSLSNSAIIYDEKGVFNSLKLSRILVKGNWWGTFGRILLLGLIGSALASALMLPIWLMSMILSMIPVVGGAIQTAIQSAVSILVAPFGAIFITKYYLGLKENKSIRK